MDDSFRVAYTNNPILCFFQWKKYEYSCFFYEENNLCRTACFFRKKNAAAICKRP